MNGVQQLVYTAELSQSSLQKGQEVSLSYTQNKAQKDYTKKIFGLLVAQHFSH